MQFTPFFGVNNAKKYLQLKFLFFNFTNKKIKNLGPCEGLFFWLENFKFEENADYASTCN